jgi:hypothetical protein
MIWSDFEKVAPEIAGLGKERFDYARVALLGTLRSDGLPRISPVEPYFVKGHLLFGVMSNTVKARDLSRDPRCLLHSAVTGPDNAEGEFKLYGVAREVLDSKIREAEPKAWWVGRPAGVARVFDLDIMEAAFISWDLERGKMTVRLWSPTLGIRTITRKYP